MFMLHFTLVGKSMSILDLQKLQCWKRETPTFGKQSADFRPPYPSPNFCVIINQG